MPPGRPFDGLQLERSDDSTVLFGPVQDQAYLVGLIERGQELGHGIISLAEVDDLSPA
jgi:hypothetical protein